MKKMLFFAAMLLAAVTMQAEKVTLQAGSTDWINDSKSMATISFDLNDCVVVDFGTGNKINKDFGSLDDYLSAKGLKKEAFTPQPATMDNFIAQFNKKNKKGLQLAISDVTKNAIKEMKPKRQKNYLKNGYILEDQNVKYNIVVHVDTVDMGSGAQAATSQMGGLIGLITSMPGADGGASMIGWAEVIDNDTRDVVCELHVSRFYGVGAEAKTEVRFFRALGAFISNQLPKAAKLKK